MSVSRLTDNARYLPLSLLSSPLSFLACLGHLDSGGNNEEGRTLLLDGRHPLELR